MQEEQVIKELETTLQKILSRLEIIENDIKYLKAGNDNMNRHISFVESVYDYVKSPLYYIINKVKWQIPVNLHIPEKLDNIKFISNVSK
jgi:hypothetical protein